MTASGPPSYCVKAVVRIGTFLLCIALLVTLRDARAADSKSVQIKVDQVGYLPDSAKLAFVTAQASAFEVKRASDGGTAFEGKLSPASQDADTGDSVQTADFSKLKLPGTYYLDVPGVGKSWTFSIGPDVFSHTYYLAMRAFYGQRCGTAVDLGSEFPGFAHAACHLKGEFHTSSGKQGERDNIGGWHDAGDYGRYVVNSGISTGTVLWAWEIFGPKLKSIKLNIPESGNGTPDILNEARWNLEWMLKMQDDDGGVWHKQTSDHFSGFIMPEGDNLPSVVVGTGHSPYKSTCATADLAAVASIAARVYAPFDGKFAKQNLDAARKAWLWTEEFPNISFHNPPGISTGEYGDDSCSDERLWAAAELWRTTGEKAYSDYVVKQYPDFRLSLERPAPEGWREVAAMGLWTYALGSGKGGDTALIADIRKRTLQAAHAIVESTRTNRYRVSLRAMDYVWGSNGVAASYGMEVLVANVLTPDPAFVESALDDLHYLLGRNTFSLSWVTQVGENPYHHPHHRPSGADKNAEPWPGLLSGGPNAGRQDDVLKKLPAGLPPAKVYADDQGSYASNEIAINWQASLVFLLAGALP
ncbi:MAG TPA: glycoside hydrolase family 9 protein [Candidatus Sulfotelmatobacter sp.]|nr:glycoside hydrolase family 9 protein [Candidatus Sulfotelmatobacter sp.]